MTREIKFRAWDEESSTMIYPGEFSHDGFYLECCDGKPFLMLSPNDEMDDGFSHPEHREKSAIMQFTGLKDKNGKEIFEGDIVNFGVDLDCIIFSFGAFHLEKMSSCYCRHVLVSECNHEIEIIGNICENPELLEAKND